MHPDATAKSREGRFTALYDGAYADLLRFVRRRIHPAHAEDVVSEVMLVAWRRLDDVPTESSAARAWLFGVAYKTMMNTRRREAKQDAIAVRLADAALVSRNASHAADVVAESLDVAAAWPRLSATHQEALTLTFLDGLTAPEAARVLDITPVAFRLRLSRARRTLRLLISSADGESGDLTMRRSSER